jgi:hypothetical protein
MDIPIELRISVGWGYETVKFREKNGLISHIEPLCSKALGKPFVPPTQLIQLLFYTQTIAK